MENNNLITLNKFLADAGVCSRRKAADEVKAGRVTVNGKIIKDPSAKIESDDKVCYQNKPVVAQSKVYILMNKPEGFVTTVSDEEGRRTVMDLLKGDKRIGGKRLYPVGRLDVTTTGLLLITNDGELTQTLAHPKFGVSKTYKVILDQHLSYEAFQAIKHGLRLEDGLIKPDRINYASKTSHKKLVVEIHSGKNRIIRRMFKAVGYNVVKLERVEYAGLVKKGLPLGAWRFLTAKEISELHRMFYQDKE